MNYWHWWLSGLALSGVMVFHWLSLKRMMAVSGRITGLVDRFRFGSLKPAVPMTAQEMLAAVQAASVEEFGTASADGVTPDAPVVSAHVGPS
jgi:hypothetical protein